jgi:N-acetylmuramoyl-L-alanine amidase
MKSWNLRSKTVSSLSVRAVKLFIAFLLAVCVGTPAFSQSFSKPQSSTKRVLLPEAARHFGISTSWKPAEWKVSLARGNHKAEILIGSDRLMVDGSLMDLSEPVLAREGSISMELEDATDLFSRLLDRTVTETEIYSAGLILHRHATVTDGGFIRNVHHVSYPRFTRLIINISADRDIKDVNVRCIEGFGVLTVEIPDSRFAKLAEPIDIGDGIVEHVEFAHTGADASLIIDTVAEKIEYDLQKFDDPPRIVIDVALPSPAIVTDYFGHSMLPPEPSGWPEPQVDLTPEHFPLTTVVIDPGHGGKDYGAQGPTGLFEKEVTLDIALKVRELLKERLGLKVVLTRTGDYFVSLKERSATANHAKDGAPADLFISIHTNAHRSSKIGGFEAYYISDAIDEDAKATAALENAVIEFERDMNGVNTSVESSVIPILWDLQFTNFISQSSEFASIAQREMGRRLKTRNRGVRQAPFIVLAGVAMPAILIEVGFISNRVEEANLKTTDFRKECAEALVSAITILKERDELRLGQLDEGSNP